MALSRLIIFWLWLLATGNIVFSQDHLLKKQKQPLIAISNVEFFNNTIYVGAMNKLLTFDLDLNITKEVDTCTGSCVSNYNKVLVISKETQRVLHCGTGYGGMCEMRNITDLSQSLLNTSQSNDNRDVKVSDNRKRPATAIFNLETFYLAKSFSDDDDVLKTENEIMKYCGILERDKGFQTLGIGNNAAVTCLYIAVQNSELKDYVIYYKDTFIYGDNVYFLTNQKEYVGANDYVSKVVRLCMLDKSYQSHIDMELTCEKDGMEYNLIQDSVILNVSGNSVLVAVFANGSDPENISGTGIICTLDMKTINKKLQESLIGFGTNCNYNRSKQYLDLVANTGCLASNESNQNNYTCTSATEQGPLRHFAIGNGTAQLKWQGSSFAHEGYFTSLRSSQYNQNHVVFAGTSNGFVIKYVMTENGLHQNEACRLHQYETLLADQGNEVKDMIILNDDHFFVISESNVLKYQSTDCTEYKTCKDLMENKNPLCGWCVYENRSLRKESCKHAVKENHWIPSQGECVSIDAYPKGYPSGDEKILVTLTVEHLPEGLPMDSYKCKIDGKEYNASINDTLFTCNISNIKEHTTKDLALIVEQSNGNGITLASTLFRFFNCSEYSLCSTCVETIRGTCRWCALQGHCESNSTSSPCSHSVPDKFQSCPKLQKNTSYLHTDVESTLEVEIESTIFNTTDLKTLKVMVDSANITKQKCRFMDGKVDCNVTFKARSEAKTLEIIEVQYRSEQGKLISIDGKSEVIVYNCTTLSDNMCNYCQALNTSRFRCKWDTERNSCTYCLQSETCGHKCPRPKITEILPRDGFIGKGLLITVTGEEFGTTEEIVEVQINGKRCVNQTLQYIHANISKSEDFSKNITKGFICTLDRIGSTKTYFYRDNSKGESLPVDNDIIPKWKKGHINSIEPTSGPNAGGTMITIRGENLGVGNRIISEVLFSNNIMCENPEVYPHYPSCIRTEFVQPPFAIVCKTPNVSTTTEVTLDQVTAPEVEVMILNESLKFNFLDNPVIENISPERGFLSGGTVLTVKGKNLNHANAGTITLAYNSEVQVVQCVIDHNSSAQVLCKVPPATQGIIQELNGKAPSNNKRKKRSAQCVECVTVTIIVKLDGIEHSFNISYFHDPSISKFDKGVLLYQSDQQYLEIKGKNLNLVAAKHDINITIGLGVCNVVELEGDFMRCKAPSSQPQPGIPGATLPEVNVTIGNIHTTLGYIEYQQKFESILIIAGAAAGAALFLLVLVVAFFVCKYRKVGSKAKALEKQLNDLELEIKHIAKEEFLDMQTSMSTVNRNLIEQGFPYHSYQQYACNAMFATDYLMSDPVMSDELRARARTGMERFQGLLENKFFLVSLITTMEKQKHFFIKEKSNFAGNLCAIMMGRMDYMHQVLQVLITQLVEDPSSKRGVKSLFRRSESITEKLLSNWLSLCLYPHLKDHTGSLLYLLYIATRKTMEAGPIDALTNDAKYTLSEEKLLRKYQGSATDEETTDVKFEAKALTLNVVVDNGEEIYPCKALDCDTVNQVKAKCLDQIYVNYPASQLPVDPTELLLEWHAGFSGRMILRDKDNTSKRDGEWIRVNTLAHYAVADQSNMALVDPRNAELSQQEDYVNLAQIDPGFDVNSMGSDQPLTAECSTSHDEENPMELKQWHLLKDDDANKKEKSAIDELYLNRLITTKLSLVKYIDDLFSLVLESSKCPPPVKFLYDFLDDLAEKQKIDPDTLHAWKSHSYSIRIWAMLIKTPSILFDINAPSYVSESLDVISQVFIESFSRTEQAVSKESPTQKLIFRNELTKFRTHVQEFYKNVKENVQKPDELGQYLTSINRNQQETTFNKNAALYRLYEQIKPYTDEILDDLSICQETRCLQLNKKLDDIFSMMEE